MALLKAAIGASEPGGEQRAALMTVQEKFESDWKKLGDLPQEKGGKSHFVIYVDFEWSKSRGFRLFEIFDSDTKGFGVVAGTILAREWMSRQIPGAAKKAEGQTFLPKFDRPRRLKWTERRSTEGVLQSSVIHVQVIKGSAHVQGRKMEYVEVPTTARITSALNPATLLA